MARKIKSILTSVCVMSFSIKSTILNTFIMLSTDELNLAWSLLAVYSSPWIVLYSLIIALFAYYKAAILSWWTSYPYIYFRSHFLWIIWVFPLRLYLLASIYININTQTRWPPQFRGKYFYKYAMLVNLRISYNIKVNGTK